MVQSDTCNDKKISVNATTAQNQKLTAGRQNLLSAIWKGSNASLGNTMPNGDPPALMLWGAEDQVSSVRYASVQGGARGR